MKSIRGFGRCAIRTVSNLDILQLDDPFAQVWKPDAVLGFHPEKKTTAMNYRSDIMKFQTGKNHLQDPKQ